MYSPIRWIRLAMRMPLSGHPPTLPEKYIDMVNKGAGAGEFRLAVHLATYSSSLISLSSSSIGFHSPRLTPSEVKEAPAPCLKLKGCEATVVDGAWLKSKDILLGPA